MARLADSIGGNIWATVLRYCLNSILSAQHADGYWTYTHSTDGDGNPIPWTELYPYANGLMCNNLITYYETFSADARIPPAIKKCMEWMWTNVRDMSTGVYKDSLFYIPQNNAYPETRSTANGGPDVVPFHIDTCGFLYNFYGDITWKTRGDLLLSCCMEGDGEGQGGGSNVGLWKQFTEMYTASLSLSVLSAGNATQHTGRAGQLCRSRHHWRANEATALTCGAGTWSNTPTSRTYRWVRYTLSPATTLLATTVGTDSSTYTVSAADVGKHALLRADGGQCQRQFRPCANAADSGCHGITRTGPKK